MVQNGKAAVSSFLQWIN